MAKLGQFERRIELGRKCLPEDIQKALETNKSGHDKRMIKRLLNALGYYIEQLTKFKDGTETYKVKRGHCSALIFALYAAAQVNNLKYDSSVIESLVDEVRNERT